jgi:hypothetical protein
VANNPINSVDPTGHWDETSVWWNPFTWFNGSGGSNNNNTNNTNTNNGGSSSTQTPAPTVTVPTTTTTTVDTTRMKTVYDQFKTENPTGTEGDITPDKVKDFATRQGLTDAEKMYLVNMIAHDNTNFNPETINGNSVTWCNAYAAYALWLFNGSTALMQPGADPSKFGNFRDPYDSSRGSSYWTLPTNTDDKNSKGQKFLDIQDVLSGDKFDEVANITDANKLALEGKFVVAFTPGHILTIVGCLEKPMDVNYRVAKGADEFKKGQALAVGQQGRSSLLYGVTSKGTMVNAYLYPDYAEVKYYVFK